MPPESTTTDLIVACGPCFLSEIGGSEQNAPTEDDIKYVAQIRGSTFRATGSAWHWMDLADETPDDSNPMPTLILAWAST